MEDRRPTKAVDQNNQAPTAPAMLWNIADVQLEKLDRLPEGEPAFMNWWEERTRQVHALESDREGFFNGTGIAVTGIEPNETGGVTVKWTQSDYVHALTVLTTANEKLPESVTRPAWCQFSGITLLAPLGATDGLVWARRSQQVRLLQGVWMCGSAEAAETADMSSKDWKAAGARGLSEEFAVHDTTLQGVFLEAGIQRHPGPSSNLTSLVFWLPSTTTLSFKDVESSWKTAADHWEHDALSLGEAPQQEPSMTLPEAVAHTLQRK